MAQSISDEELQFKKRARRRLVGAIALVMLAVVFLPMVLDKEPKPVGQDIAIRIPSQESTAFQPQETAPDSVQKIGDATTQAAPKTADSKPATEPVKPESRPVVVAGGAAQAEQPASHKPAAEPVAVTPTQPVHKEAQPKPAVKPADKTAKTEQTGKAQGYVIQLGAFANLDNAKQRQAKLSQLGVRFYSEKVKTPSGEKLRVRAGPYATREEAEKVQARLKAQGIQDGVVAENNG